MKGINLRKLAVDELLILRDRINVMLESRVAAERRSLEIRLKRLQNFQAAGTVANQKTKSAASELANKPKAATKAKKKTKITKKVATKFRNPDNPSETWTGRGLQPRWMRAALNDGGKNLEDFRI